MDKNENVSEAASDHEEIMQITKENDSDFVTAEQGDDGSSKNGDQILKRTNHERYVKIAHASNND